MNDLGSEFVETDRIPAAPWAWITRGYKVIVKVVNNAIFNVSAMSLFLLIKPSPLFLNSVTPMFDFSL